MILDYTNLSYHQRNQIPNLSFVNQENRKNRHCSLGRVQFHKQKDLSILDRLKKEFPEAAGYKVYGEFFENSFKGQFVVSYPGRRISLKRLFKD